MWNVRDIAYETAVASATGETMRLFNPAPLPSDVHRFFDASECHRPGGEVAELVCDER